MSEDNEIPKVVDQQILDENPVLAEAGVEVGSEISETDEPTKGEVVG